MPIEYDPLVNFKRFCRRKNEDGTSSNLKDTSEAFRKFFHDLSVSVEKPDCDEKYEEFRERYKQLQKEELTLKEIAIVSDDTQDVIKRLKQHKNFNKKKFRQFVKKIDKEIVYSSNKKESENSNKISRVIRGKKSFNRYIQKYINNHKMSLKKNHLKELTKIVKMNTTKKAA